MNASPRVLLVLEATLGGTRRYLEDIFDALGGGSHVGLAYSLHRSDASFGSLLERIRSAGWQLFEIDMHREIEPRNDFACVLALRRVYAQFKPDVVHAHSSKAGALARLATFGVRRRPGIVYSPNAIAAELHPIYHVVERILATRLDVLAAVTGSERRQLEGMRLVPPERVRVIVPTIRADVFSPVDARAARAQLGLADVPLIVAVGRLTEQKDPLAFVEIVASVRRRIRGLRAMWIGDGELRDAMERRIAELDLIDVLSITGWLEDVRPYIAASDVVVSSASYESFGYSNAEALAMQRPVVASAITGTVDVVTSDTEALLYRYRDVEAAAERAVRLLQDAPYAEAVAQRAREKMLATFSIAETRRGLVEAYAAAQR